MFKKKTLATIAIPAYKSKETHIGWVYILLEYVCQWEFYNFFCDVLCFLFRLRVEDLSPPNISLLRNALTQYFKSSTFIMSDNGSSSERQTDSSGPHVAKFGKDFKGPDLFFLPLKLREDSQKIQFESYSSMLGKLRDQVLPLRSFIFYYQD